MNDEGQEPNDTSEWNEQQQFSHLYFEVTRKCRDAQAERKLSNWVSYLDCKILLALSIQDDKVKANIKEKRKELLNMHGRFINASGKSAAVQANLLNEMLFNVEADVDTMTNAKMPFLRLPEKFDVEDF